MIVRMFILPLLAALLAGSLAGCMTEPPAVRPVAIVTVKDPQRRLPAAGSRYVWAPGSGVINADPRLDSGTIEAVLRQRLEEELGQRGYRPAGDPAVSDFQVGYWLVLEGELDEGALAERLGFQPGLVGAAPGGRQEKGTLGIDFIDPRGGVEIWRAAMQGYLDPEAGARERRERLDAAVASLLRRLPAE